MDITCLAAPTLAGEIRERMEFRLAAWGLVKLTDDATLVASELIANACAATPEEKIRIWFKREPAAVLFGVWDSSDEMSQAKEADLDLSQAGFDDNGGWGLPLVQALSAECGVSKTPPHGKWVWARLVI